jgi:hypothetical protein
MPFIGNYPLLWQTLHQAHTVPERYDQGWWWHLEDCGTTRCIAGWAAHFGGFHEPDMSNAADAHLITEHLGGAPRSVGEYDHLVISPTAVVISAERAALLALDAAHDDAVRDMFASYVSFGFILRRARNLAERDGAATPDWLDQAIREHPLGDDDPDYLTDNDTEEVAG